MITNYPIVEIETKDGIPLYGLYSKAPNSKTILINIHGTASNFYENYYMQPLTKAALEQNISILSTNNRGAAVMQVYPHAGAALEHFEDCLIDIDAWIEFALSKGYKKIILQGHSLGSEKVVYYMNKGKHRDKVKKIVLLGPADSYGETERLLRNKKKKLIEEAKKLVKNGNSEQFLTSVWLCHGDVLPKGADSFLNFFDYDSENSKTLPFRNGKNLYLYSQIKIPILVVIGDKKEYTIIPIKEALALMEKENKMSRCYQIKNCNHDFEHKEAELTKIIIKFVKQ
jgi:pimeloyl-ACP methyl ester carboxylesterase